MKRTSIKLLIRVVLAPALILLVPLMAMQFTNEVAWKLADFALAETLLVGTGLMYLSLARSVNKPGHRLVAGAALVAALFLVWGELAVGIIGTPFAGS
ncbi:MAG: hypothetical protein V4508_01930 [Pseudomonadota bacterium]